MNDYYHESTDGHPDNNTSHLPSDSPDDGTQFSAAAGRVKNAVKPEGGRKEGGATYAPEALALAPHVLGTIAKHVISGAYKKATE